MGDSWHRTKRALVDTVVAMLDEDPFREPTCDAVLIRSGISRGSLYHFFEDYADLVEHAEVVRFTRYVDDSAVLLRLAMAESQSREELRARIEAFSRETQSQARAPRRAERTVALANASRHPRLRSTLGREQLRLTTVLGDLIRDAQERGWMGRDFDADAAAVLIQAYTVGRVVDDISPRPVDPEAWSTLVLMIVERVFGLAR